MRHKCAAKERKGISAYKMVLKTGSKLHFTISDAKLNGRGVYLKLCDAS